MQKKNNEISSSKHTRHGAGRVLEKPCVYVGNMASMMAVLTPRKPLPKPRATFAPSFIARSSTLKGNYEFVLTLGPLFCTRPKIGQAHSHAQQTYTTGWEGLAATGTARYFFSVTRGFAALSTSPPAPSQGASIHFTRNLCNGQSMSTAARK